MLPGEPGASYVTALRRWPNEIGCITDTEFTSRLGLSRARMSAMLQNKVGRRATDAVPLRGVIM